MRTWVIASGLIHLVLASGTAGYLLGTSHSAIRTTIVTSRIPPSASTSGLHEVTFQLGQYCGRYNILPWSVAIGGAIEVQPSNQTLPLPTNSFSTIVRNQNLTRMVFWVPSGNYSYTITGGVGPGGGLYPDGGTVSVKDMDVVVQVNVWLGFTCTTSTTTT